jgi:hypothetical protein
MRDQLLMTVALKLNTNGLRCAVLFVQHSMVPMVEGRTAILLLGSKGINASMVLVVRCMCQDLSRNIGSFD